MMVVDPKGESYDYTAGYRSTFSEVFYFDPTINAEEAKARHIKPCHINPLDFIPRTSEAVAEIGKVVCRLRVLGLAALLCLLLH